MNAAAALGSSLLRVGHIAAAVATLMSVTTVAPAHAAPPGFPDLSRFTQGDSTPFVRPVAYDQRWTSGYVFFRTPDRISCAIGASSWCTGPIPGLRADQQSTCPSVTQGVGPKEPFAFGRSDQSCVPTSDAILEPGRKLINDAYGVTCAVGDGQLTACVDAWTNHGFVLQPSGSWVF
jgi:hypothetical protein